MVAIVGSIAAELLLDRSQFDAGLGRAGITTKKFENETRASLGRVDRGFSSTFGKVGGFGTSMAAGFLAPVAGLLTLGAALNGTRAALDHFGDIADRAAESGLSSDYFQGIAYSAKLAGVEFNTFSSAMATFAKNAGLAAEGKGKMVSALSALNPALLENIQNATTQEQRLRLAADALNSTADAAQKAALAAALFGDSGIVLAKAFEGGAAAMDQMVIKAKELGLVVDQSVIARAEELGDKLDTASQVVDLNLKVALMDLAPLMADAAGWAAEFARLLGIAYEQTKSIEDRQFLRPLQNELAKTYNEMGPVKDRIAEIEDALSGGAPNGMILKLDLSDAKAELATLEEQAMRLLTRVTEIQGAPKAGTGAVTPAATPSSPRNPAFAGGADLAVLDLKHPDPAKVEQISAGFRSVATSAEASTIAIASSADAVDHLQDRFDDAKRMASNFTSGLIGDLMSGVSAVESLGNAFSDIAQQLLKLAADQVIASFLDSIVSAFMPGMGGNFIGGTAGAPPLKIGFQTGIPGFAGGTNYAPGGLARVYEEGGEIIDLPRGSRVIPHDVSMAMASAAKSESSSTTVRMVMPEGWKAEILEQAGSNTVKIVQANQKANSNYKMNGGN